jgi:predicted SAM-dependent methyltransferase
MEKMMRVNVGCGQNPTEGWRNFDNSLSLRLAKIPFLPALLYKARILEAPQYQFMLFARSNRIEYGDVAKRLPLSDGSVEVLYSSHMLEHLDREDTSLFLKEVRRVLCPGGIIRLAVPDIHKHVQQYIESGDADAFIAGTLLCHPYPRTIVHRLRILLVGTRHHQWMYDGVSLCRLLLAHGFVKVEIMQAGETKVLAPESLDLQERVSESVYVEAENPVEAKTAFNEF